MRRVLEPQRVGVCRAALVPRATQPKLWSVSSSSAIGASSPPSDGLPQRGILLVHGVRARQGGVAREGEGAQFVRTHKSVARTASSAAEHCIHATEKGSVCSWHIFHLEENGSSGVGFKLRLARSTVLGSRRPGPPAPAGQARGGLKAQRDVNIFSHTSWGSCGFILVR